MPGTFSFHPEQTIYALWTEEFTMFTMCTSETSANSLWLGSTVARLKSCYSRIVSTKGISFK